MAGNFPVLPVFDIQNIESTVKIVDYPGGRLDPDKPTIASDGTKPSKWALTIEAVANCYTWIKGEKPGATDPGVRLKWWATFKEIDQLMRLGVQKGDVVVVSRGGTFRAAGRSSSPSSSGAPQLGIIQPPPRREAHNPASGSDALRAVFSAQALMIRMAKEALIASGIAPDPRTVATLANSLMIAWEKMGSPPVDDFVDLKQSVEQHSAEAPPPQDDDDGDVPF
jgi:hypothetical protein